MINSTQELPQNYFCSTCNSKPGLNGSSRSSKAVHVVPHSHWSRRRRTGKAGRRPTQRQAACAALGSVQSAGPTCGSSEERLDRSGKGR